MPLTILTAPALEPVTLSEARLHCRVDSTDENALLTALIVAAREHVENLTGRALITRTYLLLAAANGYAVELPMPPFVALSSVQTVDELRDAEFASAAFGALPNGLVTVTNAVAGVVGNGKTVTRVAGVGVGVPLSVAFATPAITVTLGTDGAGAPDPTKNTSLLVAAALTASAAGVTATASGSGATVVTPGGPSTLAGGFGTLATVAATAYDLSTLSIVPTVTVSELPSGAQTLRVEYSAGYGDAAADVPQALRQAILLLVGHWYAQREAAATANMAEVPYAVRALCDGYRMQFMGMGAGR